MTYKKMVEGIVERDCQKWVDGFLADKEKMFSLGEKTTLEIDKGTCFFHSEIKVYGAGNIIAPTYTVGGTVDEDGRVYKSIIKNMSGKIVWAATKELRDMEGINEFQIK